MLVDARLIVISSSEGVALRGCLDCDFATRPDAAECAKKRDAGSEHLSLDEDARVSHFAQFALRLFRAQLLSFRADKTAHAIAHIAAASIAMLGYLFRLIRRVTADGSGAATPRRNNN